MNQQMLGALLGALLTQSAQARMMQTCGGTVLAVNERTGATIASFTYPDMQIGGNPRTKVAVSESEVKVAYPRCLRNSNKEIPGTWLPVEWPKKPTNRTVYLSTPELKPLTRAKSKRWIDSLTPMPFEGDGIDEVKFKDGDRLIVYDGEARVCSFSKKPGTKEWCQTLDPNAAKRAGGSLRLEVYRLKDDYLFVTDYMGAFRFNQDTGEKKWSLEYSNADEIPSVALIGDRLVFVPRQEWLSR